MNRIDRALQTVTDRREKMLSVFLTAGYPSIKATEELIVSLAKSGVGLFEIGFPFSDPIADGPVIQRSSEQALKNGITWQDILQLAKRVRARTEVPLILMTYSNAFYCRTWKQSLAQISKAGYDGIIVPDLIPEESSEIDALCAARNLRHVYLAAPTSSDERLQHIGKTAGGFIYCVSVAGVTGARVKLPREGITQFLHRVRQYSRVPILLGFGISSPEQCRDFSKAADGFIIGSKMIETISEPLPLPKLIEKAKKLITPFAKIMIQKK